MVPGLLMAAAMVGALARSCHRGDDQGKKAGDAQV